MYVNTPVGQTVNVRATASTSATIKFTLSRGAQVDATFFNSTWHSITCPQGSGFIMSEFLSSTNPNSGGAGTPTPGKIQGTQVRVRTSPSTSATIIREVNTGDSVTYYDGESYSGNGYTWYRCTSTLWNGNGYIVTNYVVPDTGGGGVIGTALYYRNFAVDYAMQYSSNTPGTASYNPGYRPVYDDNGNVTNDCANFVSQCLYAGGMPMNPTWYYKTPNGVYTDRTAAWKGTVSLKNMLENRKWATRVVKSQVKKGDIAFTYESENSLPHVVFVVRDVGPDGNVYVCGHTANQRDVIRNPGINTIYYHVHDSFQMLSGDWL